MYNHQIIEGTAIVLLIISAWKGFCVVITNEMMRIATALVLFLLLTTTWWEENVICDVIHSASYLFIFIILIFISSRKGYAK